jgi:tungstate transport system substrate-binding protein
MWGDEDPLEHTGMLARSRCRLLVPAVALLLAGLPACRSEPDAVRIATTTSVDNSGLLAAILPDFERRHDVKVDVLAVGSGQALNLLERGDATVGLTHDPRAERSALAVGVITGYRKIMFNDFVIVGPLGDPARIAGASDAAGALRRIIENGALFASRGDGSGTHSREQDLWALAGARPRANHLVETGQGMGATLRVASERHAYTLTDRATFEQFRSDLQLAVHYESGADLLNTYAIFLSAGATGRSLSLGTALVDWLADGEGRNLVANFRANGRTVFTVWPAGMPRERPTDTPVSAAENVR